MLIELNYSNLVVINEFNAVVQLIYIVVNSNDLAAVYSDVSVSRRLA